MNIFTVLPRGSGLVVFAAKATTQVGENVDVLMSSRMDQEK